MAGAPASLSAVVDLGADDGVRADEDALAALDAELLVPDRDSRAMLRFSHCAVAVGKVPSTGSRLTGRASPSPAMIGREHVLHECRAPRSGTTGGSSMSLRRLGRDLDFVQVAEGGVDGGEVLLHDALAALAVGLLDGVLDLLDGLFARQHAADGEEAGLHDGVDAGAHAGLLGHLVAVDDVELQFLLDDLLLHRARQLVPDLVAAVRAVEQEGGARCRHSSARRASRGR